MIDLRSDTVTQPTEAMRQAIARAEVGDDVYGDDPSVVALESAVAEVLGKPAAVYMPTGTMTNQVAIRAHTRGGDDVLLESRAHIYESEAGAPAALSGVNLRFIHGEDGTFGPEQLEGALPVPHPFSPATLDPETTLLCIENTHNGAGGVVWPLETIQQTTSKAREHGLATHLDGARLWNAAVASHTAERDYAACFDSVSVCFSKGLGAPMGSALVGSEEFIRRARRAKQLFGGGFRQAGMMAAGALFALRHHRDRLAEDHHRARRLAEALAEVRGIEIKLDRVQSNIVRFELTSQIAAHFVERCHANQVHVLPNGLRGVRAVTHLGIEDDAIERAIEVMSEAA